MTIFKSIVLAFRPKTLTAALVPCISATALCVGLNIKPDLYMFLYALLSAICIQIGTNFINDAIDFKKGADNQNRIGPTRITQAGLLEPKTVLMLGAGSFILAILFGIPLVVKGGTTIVVIGLISVLMGYAYTAGPFPLAYLGLGDLFVILFFGIIAVMGMFFLHTGLWSLDALVLGLQVGFHATVLIAINNMRDAEGDRLVDKKTLAVRFGKTFSRLEILFLSYAPFFINVYWLQKGMLFAGYLPYLIFPLAVHIAKSVFRNEPSELYNKFLAQSAALHLGFGILLSIGFILK